MGSSEFINIEIFVRSPEFHIIESTVSTWPNDFDCYSIVNCGFHSAYIFEDFNVIFKLKYYKDLYLAQLANNLPETAYWFNITDWDSKSLFSAGKYHIDRDNSKIVYHRYN